MRAGVHHRFGPPSVLAIEEVPKPEPGRGEVRVRVEAATVNRTDCGFRAARPAIVRLFAGFTRPRRPVIGTEFAGIVDETGPGVTGFAPGDAVCGRMQDEQMGACAEYLIVHQDAAIVRKPEALSMIEAAALCDGPMLADIYLRRVDPATHPRMLINGASGSIGSAGLQLAVAAGFTVTATAKTEALEIVRGLGPARVIDYRETDYADEDAEYDVVFDAVGKSTLARAARVLRPGGVYMSSELGPWGQNPAMALKTAVLGGRVKVHFPVPRYTREDAAKYALMAEAGQYRPVIDGTWPLDRIVEATERVETGEKIGNVVIHPVQQSAAP